MSEFSQNASQVGRVYHQVIKDVIHSCRDIFADEGCDEQVLNDLAALWKRKLHVSYAHYFFIKILSELASNSQS